MTIEERDREADLESQFAEWIDNDDSVRADRLMEDAIPMIRELAAERDTLRAQLAGLRQQRMEDDAHRNQEIDTLRTQLAEALERERWIPVEERLPEPLRLVLLVIDNYTQPTVGHLSIPESDGRAQWSEWDRWILHHRVTHWRPMPAVPTQSDATASEGT
jgi:ribosomal protein L29